MVVFVKTKAYLQPEINKLGNVITMILLLFYKKERKETQYLIIDCRFQPIKYYLTRLNNSNKAVLSSCILS